MAATVGAGAAAAAAAKAAAKQSAMLTTFKEHALKILLSRPHSTVELSRKLQVLCLKRTQSPRAKAALADGHMLPCPQLVNQTLETLQKDHPGLLDDAHFAQWFVAQRETYKCRSSRHLSAELAARGVSRGDIATALENYDELEAAVKAAKKQGRRAEAADLVKQGFSWKLAAEAIAAAKAEENDSTTQE